MEILKSQQVCQYFGGLHAVEKVDMSVEKGEIFGIIGPNGAGKTTFFNACSGINHPTSGDVYLKEQKITGMKPEQIARLGMARTFQNIQLFRYMTVLENVKIGFHISNESNFTDALLRTKRYKAQEKSVHESALKILEKVNLTQYKDVMAGNLAYGIQRKVEIARCLALSPEIILLDEPAAGMNPNETQELSDFVKQLNQDGYTIVVIEHDMKFIMNLCHRIMVLNFGQKICEGTPDEVKVSKEVHIAYFGKGMMAMDAKS
ncbi:MAG: ABC transporter ATP-binding protein [Hydrogenoanaerobacterium sp.]